MSRFMSAAAFSIVVAAVSTFGAVSLAQGVQTTAAVPPLQSPLAATVGELKNLRLARPLSRDEEAALRPLDHFKECELCPEMIVVPAGYFLMGAKDGEPGSTPDERPQHEVYFAQPFSVGRFPVTFSEWDACVAARGCSYQPTDQGWGKGRRPVVNILWDDAKEYVSWLSRTTSRPYRLLSEAEREHVARAGTRTAYWWGDSFFPAQANALLPIPTFLLRALATYRNISRARKPCRFSHLLPIPGGSIRSTATSTTGSRTAGMTITVERLLMARP